MSSESAVDSRNDRSARRPISWRGREKGPPRLRIPALTASHQVEQVRADRFLRQESSIHGRPGNKSLLSPTTPHVCHSALRLAVDAKDVTTVGDARNASPSPSLLAVMLVKTGVSQACS